MSLNFPSNPILSQVYTSGGKSWIWNGYAWDVQGATCPPGDCGCGGGGGGPGPIGPTGATGIGITGAAGPTGATGIGITGAAGPTGATGQGYTGITISGGSLYVSPVFSDGTVGSSLNLGNVLGATGSQGATGPVGPTGAPGDGVAGNNDIGLMFLKDNGTATTIPTTNSRAVVAGNIQTGTLYNFAKDAGTNSLKYLGPGGRFHVVASFNFITEASNKTCGFYIGRNTDSGSGLSADADRISQSEVYIRSAGTNEPVAGTIQTVVDLNTNDRLFFIVQNQTSDHDITVEFLSFVVSPVTSERGASGPTGPTGPIGATGLTGLGYTGITFINGYLVMYPVFNDGSVGSTGLTLGYVVGPTGTPGAPGDLGYNYVATVNGRTGDVGIRGTTGEVGVTLEGSTFRVGLEDNVVIKETLVVGQHILINGVTLSGSGGYLAIPGLWSAGNIYNAGSLIVDGLIITKTGFSGFTLDSDLETIESVMLDGGEY